MSNGSNPVGMLRNEVDKLFSDFFGPHVGTAESGVRGRAFPALNVWERDNELFVEAEVAGLRNEDLDISVMGNQLVIKGRRADVDEESATYHRRERRVGEFSRAIELPVAVKPEQVQARLSDGVLLITLPKAEAAKPRKVQVTT
ncbi:MAG TPA: Hsp20/alpha crystallin family protein [Pirellulales bacterium]|nr:Hsp20/alpha crystallin family protein [Pirellulales bacterium]